MYADKDSAGTGEAKDKSEADRAIDIVEAKLLEVFKEDGYLSENASTACSLMFLQCPSRSWSSGYRNIGSVWIPD